MKRQHVGIIRDHSASMHPLATYARDDYNMQLNVLKSLAISNDIETSLTVVECGTDSSPGLIRVERERERIEWIPELYAYSARGCATPLFDSVGRMIEIFEKVPAVEDVSFLVVAITDGQDNMRNYWNPQRLSRKIADLQVTERWTFAFRVPRGYKSALVKMGIYEDNILEWEQTRAGVEEASQATIQAYTNYMSSRAAGQTSTTKFFTNLDHISSKDLKSALQDITGQVIVAKVETGQEGQAIKSFVEMKLAIPYVAGQAFYQLVKPEKVQAGKDIIIFDKSSNSFYSGANARNILGLPHYGEIKVNPGNHADYEIFVQSRSVNRILPVGTKVLVSPIRRAYQ